MHGGISRNQPQSGAYAVRSRFFLPPKEFSGCFTSFYHLDLSVADGGTLSDHLQPEWGSIRFFSGSTPDASLGETRVSDANFGVSGPSSMPLHFTLGTARMWGIGFLPLGWARFVDVDASGLANQIFDGTQHPAFARFAEVGDIAVSAAMGLDEQFEMIVAAMRKFIRPHRNEERILRVHRALVEQQPSSVVQFAESTELSVRGLERVCARHFGFTPKTLIRRQRFMRSLTAFMLQKDSKWTAVIDEHYHDQAQFSREFRAFMGMSPSEYADQEHPFLDSFVEARARMLGSAALTLDRPA